MAGSAGVIHGMRTYLLQDDEGQTLATHSVSAGLDYPGVGPEHSWLRETGRARYIAVDDRQAMDAFALLCRTEGIIPAMESAHALAGALEVGRELGPDALLLVNLSGRGDKDMDTAARWFGLMPGAADAATWDPVPAGAARPAAGEPGEHGRRRVRQGGGRRPGRGHRLPASRLSHGGCAGSRRRWRWRAAARTSSRSACRTPTRLIDGPVIQEAVHRALTGGVRVADVLRTVEAVAGAGVPALVMTYWNPVDRYGVQAFAADLAAAGGAGLITPDLTPEEADPWLAAAAAHDLDAVFLAAVSSTQERIARVAAACRGFVYAASLMGVTGVRDAVSRDAEDLVGRIRKHTTLPVAVGLGVRDGTQAAQVARFADGVIVGSAFVRRLLEAAPAGRRHRRRGQPGRRAGRGRPRARARLRQHPDQDRARGIAARIRS